MAALTAKAAKSWNLLHHQHTHQYLISILISKGHFVQSSINKVVSEWVTDFGGRWSDLGLIKSIFFVKSCLFLSDHCLDLSTLYVSFCTLIFLNSCNFSKSHATFSCVIDHQAVSSKGVGRVWGSRYSAVKAIKKFCFVKVMKLNFVQLFFACDRMYFRLMHTELYLGQCYRENKSYFFSHYCISLYQPARPQKFYWREEGFWSLKNPLTGGNTSTHQ